MDPWLALHLDYREHTLVRTSVPQWQDKVEATGKYFRMQWVGPVSNLDLRREKPSPEPPAVYRRSIIITNNNNNYNNNNNNNQISSSSYYYFLLLYFTNIIKNIDNILWIHELWRTVERKLISVSQLREQAGNGLQNQDMAIQHQQLQLQHYDYTYYYNHY